MKWHTKKLRSSTTHIPSRPGIYVIGTLDELFGLPTGFRYVYVGKSTNLRQRLDQHYPWYEQNPDLADHLRRHQADLTVWYATEIEEKDLDRVERTLIRKLDPEYNRIKYDRVGDEDV